MKTDSHVNPLAGASSIGLPSIVRNRKLGVIIGLVLIGVGAWGMLSIGSNAVETVQEGEYSSEQGKAFQMDSYVFMFGAIAGLIILLYSAVSSQAESPRSRR